MAMLLLSRFVVFRTSGGYLSIPENLPASVPSGFVKFVEPNIFNPRVKFAVEPAQTGDGKLVHIRSCYNNKYLVPERVQDNDWLVASGEVPEEDQSKASCTLFEPWRNSTETTVRLRPVRTSSSAAYYSLVSSGFSSSDTQHGLVVSSRTYSNLSILDVIDWETLVFLPSHVTFKSEELDGNYLCSRVLDRWYSYQRFESGLDVGDPLAAKDLFPTPDGNYRIRDLHFGKFWRNSGNWIWADAEENNNSNSVLFSFVKISDNLVALRQLGNNSFCGAVSKEGKSNCLNADYPAISRQTRLIVEERVLARSISDVRYRLADSRIYEETIQEVSHSFATNDSPDDDATISLTYKISDTRTRHWNNSVSVKLGGSVEFKTALIPLISSGEVTLSTEIGYEHEWGGSKTTERTRETSFVAVVPPLTTMKVTLMCKKAACDVPFSYTQRDLLTTGLPDTTIKDDGIFTGINSYNFEFQSSPVTQDAQGRLYVE